MSKPVIFLDPGHGGHDPGAINRSTGLKESHSALDVCRRAKAYLINDFDVRLTRDGDTFVSLAERARMANNAGAKAFVSYHFNSATSADTALSYEAFTTKGNTKADRLATLILDAHGALFPQQKLRADSADGDPDKEVNFAVLRRTNCPAVLMEGEFIHTDHGAALISDPANRQNMALAVAQGIRRFFSVPEQDDQPEELTPPDGVPALLNSISSSIQKLKTLLNS